MFVCLTNCLHSARRKKSESIAHAHASPCLDPKLVQECSSCSCTASLEQDCCGGRYVCTRKLFKIKTLPLPPRPPMFLADMKSIFVCPFQHEIAGQDSTSLKSQSPFSSLLFCQIRIFCTIFSVQAGVGTPPVFGQARILEPHELSLIHKIHQSIIVTVACYSFVDLWFRLGKWWQNLKDLSIGISLANAGVVGGGSGGGMKKYRDCRWIAVITFFQAANGWNHKRRYLRQLLLASAILILSLSPFPVLRVYWGKGNSLQAGELA